MDRERRLLQAAEWLRAHGVAVGGSVQRECEADADRLDIERDECASERLRTQRWRVEECATVMSFLLFRP